MPGSLWMGLGVALGAVSRSGPSAPPDWLGWDAPATCPDAAYVSSAVEERLGRAPSHDEIEVHATVVDGGPRGVVLELATTPASGPTDARRLEAHDCRALADAAALLVADQRGFCMALAPGQACPHEDAGYVDACEQL